MADGAGAISSPSGIHPRLRIEWEVGRMRGGRPETPGYLYNDYLRTAYNVRLLVETLDEGAEGIGLACGYAFGVVPSVNRTAFDVPIKTAGASYRITVTSFDRRVGASARRIAAPPSCSPR